MLTRGLDDCLALYSEDEWDSFQARMDELSFTKKDFRFFSRFIYSSAILVEPDAQGRFLIPANLLAGADLQGEALVLGARRWIEIWNPEKYQQYVERYGGSFEEVAERLFTDGGQESE